ncbi:hypothetical protein EMPS_01792 [Entomortierella parvispora]|uniref:SH3 domain-containing protein n=1 Tax=Entomortierella parvispora TaxID=205924 RepID=A0A9P3LSV8_9FUNG|nr:hypothetical protein EMPS_01792 [Entomortierella parvispora]
MTTHASIRSDAACFHVLQALQSHVLFLSDRGYIQRDSLNTILTELHKLDPQSPSPSRPRDPQGIDLSTENRGSNSTQPEHDSTLSFHGRSNSRDEVLIEEGSWLQREDDHHESSNSTSSQSVALEILDVGSDRGSSTPAPSSGTNMTWDQSQHQDQVPIPRPSYVEPLTHQSPTIIHIESDEPVPAVAPPSYDDVHSLPEQQQMFEQPHRQVQEVQMQLQQQQEVVLRRQQQLQVQQEQLQKQLQRQLRQNYVVSSNPCQQQSIASSSSNPNLKEVEVMWQAQAMYDFLGDDLGDLQFKKGDIIDVIKVVNDDWWQGVLKEEAGIFPTAYVRKLSQPKNRKARTVKVLKQQLQE